MTLYDWREKVEESLKKGRIIYPFHVRGDGKDYFRSLLVKKMLELKYSPKKILKWFQKADPSGDYNEWIIDDYIVVALKRKWPKKRKYDKIYITQKEIAFINDLDITLEMKKYLLAMVVFTKFTKAKTRVAKITNGDRSYIYYLAFGEDEFTTGKHRCDTLSSQIYECCKGKIISYHNQKGKFKGADGFIKEINHEVLVADWVDWEATEGYHVVHIEKDTKELCDTRIYSCYAVCPECGRRFKISPKTKRNMCPLCYKKYRRVYKTKNMMKSRKKQKAQNSDVSNSLDHIE